MKIFVSRSSMRVPQAYTEGLILRSHTWDDWFQFETLFQVTYVDAEGTVHEIGNTKIGQRGLLPLRASEDQREGYRRPSLPAGPYEQLPTNLFSLGQDTTFYQNLSSHGDDVREAALLALRDIAFEPSLLIEVETEQVTAVSLLREVPLKTVREQFARLARGGELLTPYAFRITASEREQTLRGDKVEIQFSVVPHVAPPTNIHVLIGRNGVGKSTLLNRIAKGFVSRSRRLASEHRASAADGGAPPQHKIEISNLVSVSFSAFDEFEPITVPRDRTVQLSYHYVGLKKVGAKKDDEAVLKEPSALAREMSLSARSCLLGAKRWRWLRAVALLESDPVFAEAGLSRLIQAGGEEIIEALPSTWKRLSSGHKLVLLTVTRLVDSVVEKSLVLLDEPEAHLHPPLLSAFTRALSDLLTDRNGMAIVATHSPVVLQEVPRSCVWRLSRAGDNMSAERLSIETFGANVGILTDEVFGLEVTATGYHRLLTDAAERFRNYDEALAHFNGQIGAEGRAILRARVSNLQRGGAYVER